MPEGDTIHQAAARLRAALEGHTVTRAASSLPRLAAALGARGLAGCVVAGVDAVGKHLLIRFAREGRDVAVLHTHLGMTGSWRVHGRGRARFDPARARAVIETARAVAVCLSAPTVELLEPGASARDAALTRVGPDVLDPGFDIPAACTRLRGDPRAIGEALLDQRLLSGVGNVFKSEALFRARVFPFAPAGTLGPAALEAVVTAAVRLLRANAERFPRRTTTAGMAHRHWVYGREGKACLHCGEIVRVAPQGAPPRLTWWCPRCQQTA